jgi:hypothetical protein
MLLYNPNYPKQSREISLALYIRDGVVEASWWIMCPHNILIRKVKCEVDKKVGVWVHGRITYWCPVLSKLRTDRKQRWSAAYQSKRRLPITSGREGVKMTTSKSVFFSWWPADMVVKPTSKRSYRRILSRKGDKRCSPSCSVEYMLTRLPSHCTSAGCTCTYTCSRRALRWAAQPTCVHAADQGLISFQHAGLPWIMNSFLYLTKTCPNFPMNIQIHL